MSPREKPGGKSNPRWTSGTNPAKIESSRTAPGAGSPWERQRRLTPWS